MGEDADYFIEQQIERHMNGPSIPSTRYRDPYDKLHSFISQMHNKRIWRTKDGESLRIMEMQTGHILNCMRMMERNAKAYMGYFETYLNQMWLYDKTNGIYRSRSDIRKELQRLQTEVPLAWVRTIPLYEALHDEYSSRIRRNKSLVSAVRTRETCSPIKSVLKKLKFK